MLYATDVLSVTALSNSDIHSEDIFCPTLDGDVDVMRWAIKLDTSTFWLAYISKLKLNITVTHVKILWLPF